MLTLHHPLPPKDKTANDLSLSVRWAVWTSANRAVGIISNGTSEEYLTEQLALYTPDEKRYCGMDFTQPESSKNYFIAKTEDPNEFEVLVIGKEQDSEYSKAALKHTKTGTIVFRSATMGDSCRGAKVSHSHEWKVEFGVFCADKSFWIKLKEKMLGSQ